MLCAQEQEQDQGQRHPRVEVGAVKIFGSAQSPGAYPVLQTPAT
jgi:hypothetical protein